MSSAMATFAAAAAVAVTLSGCGSSQTSTPTPTTKPGATTTKTTTAAATTTHDFSQVCGAANVLKDKRGSQSGQAEGQHNNTASQSDCCDLCNFDASCIAWSYHSQESLCQTVSAGVNYPWGDALLDAPEWVFGAKRIETCTDCSGSTPYCGRKTSDATQFDENVYCTGCVNGSQWNEYPCFIPDACHCVSSPETSTTTVSTAASTTTVTTTAAVTTTGASTPAPVVTTTAAPTPAPVVTTTAAATTTSSAADSLLV